jgi:hypothetical protein
VGVGRKTARKRAVGTREHIISYVTEVGELFDANGMASTRLAAAVGYPGSSVAFAQLLSGMERSGLIEREVRGKRTYRIRLGPVAIAGPVGAGGLGGSARIPLQSAMPRVAAGAAGIAAAGGIPAAGTAGFDYDELARRLLVQVVRRLAATDQETSQPAPSELQQTVTGLEYELATAWTKHGKLAEENVRLRWCCSSGCSLRPRRRAPRTTPARKPPAWPAERWVWPPGAEARLVGRWAWPGSSSADPLFHDRGQFRALFDANCPRS